MKHQTIRHNFFFFTEVIVIAAIAAIITIPKARENSRQASCLNNLKQISTASMIYSDDYDGWYPIDPNREDCPPMLLDYTGDDRVFICPAAKSTTPTYACLFFNTGLKLTSLNRPSVLPMVICNCHGGKYVTVAFADGHVEKRDLPRPLDSYEEIVNFLGSDMNTAQISGWDKILENARKIDRKKGIRRSW